VFLNNPYQTFYCSRKTAARKLNNPRLLEISFITIRHWKGTMKYYKTKDIIHVKQLLGHKSIKNTMIYVNLEAALFDQASEGFTCRVAKTPEEISALIEAGFEYVTDLEGMKFFRKRK